MYDISANHQCSKWEERTVHWKKRFADRSLELFDLLQRFEAKASSEPSHTALGTIRQGRVVERAYMPEEREALGDTLSALGETTFDVYLNGRAFWRNVPAAVWDLQARRLSDAQEMALLP